MSKNSIIKLSKSDISILRLLETDSRFPKSKIAKATRLSNQSTEYRINRLLRLGVISRLFCEPNLSRLGLKTYRIYFKVGNFESTANEKEFVSYLMALPSLQWFAELEGVWDYTIRLTLSNEDELQKILTDVSRHFGKYVRSKSVVISTYQTFLCASYLTGSERFCRPSTQMTNELTLNLDRIDWKILSLLYLNSRSKTTDIAKKLNLSPDAILYRIKNLQRKGAINFNGCWIERPKFGFNSYKLLISIQYCTDSEEKKLFDYFITKPNAIYYNRVIGSWDMEIDMDFSGPLELRAALKEFKSKFGSLISDCSVLTIISDQLGNPFASF